MRPWRKPTMTTSAKKSKKTSSWKPTVGVVGCGFVGDAVAHAFEGVAEVLRHDTVPERSTGTLEDMGRDAHFIFVCVPTPTSKKTGAIDLTILDSVLFKINSGRKRVRQVVIVKSTVVPGTMEEREARYPNMRLAYNPEFLTERTARSDFLTPSRIVVGASKRSIIKSVEKLYRLLHSKSLILPCSLTEAQMIKYACNCFFACKISFFNELLQICEAAGARFDIVRSGLLTSRWVNIMHTQVPGPDGKRGFGGKCFPKDLLAFRTYAESIGVTPSILRAALWKNLEVRPEADWTKVSGAMS
jgi:UDPglucose 6-dehydrogenase